jgi:hypothetical protein
MKATFPRIVKDCLIAQRPNYLCNLYGAVYFAAIGLERAVRYELWRVDPKPVEYQ